MQEVEITPDDMQPEASAFDIDDVGAAEEAAEEVLLVFGGNADAFVQDRDGDAAAGLGFGLLMDGCAFVGEFDGVAEQVDQDVFDQAPVGGEPKVI